MRLLKPIIIDSTNRIIASVPVTFEYTDHLTGVKMTKKASTLFISEERLIGANAVTMAVNTSRITQEQFKDFIGMQTLIKTCSDNAEEIKDAILSINYKILDKAKFDRDTITKMDFMKLKDNFMEFLKKDRLIKTIPEYSSNQKLKPFRQDLNNFVLLRNIYTHGLLNFLQPKSDLVLEYIDIQTRKKQYAYVSFEILKSYNNFYSEIHKLIIAFNKTRKIGST